MGQRGSITTTTCTLLVFCSSTTITPSSPNKAFYIAQTNGLLAEVEAWADAHDTSSADFPYGIVPATPRFSGGTSRTLNGYVLYGPHQPRAIASDDRPVSGMAHEMGHALGLVHADQTCGGNANGQATEPWPPNNDGALDGVGLNTGDGVRPYATIQSTSTNPVYDLMSYCTNGVDANAWISVRNWNREVQANAPGPVHSVRLRVTSSGSSATAATAGSEGFSLSPPASPGSAGTLAITALDELASHQTTISWVLPDSGSATPVVAGEQYSLVGRDANGNVVATAGATATLIHTEFAPSEIMIQGKLPAAGVRRIDVLDGSQAIARYVASPHAPTVSFPASLAGSRVGGPRGAVLRWSSHDADGGPLTVYVRYSPDGGARWQTVYIGPDRGSVVLRSGQLAASRDARLRIYVSDGFNEAIATSARFTAVGAPPVVSIERPGHTIRLLAGAPLQLLGSAYDDRGIALGGRALVWRAGRRVLGRGTETMTALLPAGRHSVTLSARDRLGRIGTATVRVTILPAPPIVTKLRAPRRLSPRARFMTVRLATLDPATVSAGRVRRVTGRRPIAIRVAVRPGRAALAVVLVLRSGGYRVRLPLLVAR